jgi:hypothetical protein
MGKRADFGRCGSVNALTELNKTRQNKTLTIPPAVIFHDLISSNVVKILPAFYSRGRRFISGSQETASEVETSPQLSGTVLFYTDIGEKVPKIF